MAAGCACAASAESSPSGIPRSIFAVDRQVLERDLRRIIEAPTTAIPFTAPADTSGIRLAAIHLLGQLESGRLDHRTSCTCPPLWQVEAETIARYLERRPGAGAVSEDSKGILFYIPKGTA